jgi:Zn-dependent peptidase ImmA (M78 family)
MPNVIRELRDLVPLRPLTVIESQRIAELQATRFLALAGVDHPPFPESAIASLPRIQVERMTPAPVAGAAQWSRGRWLIVVNGLDPKGRARFSLGHEFKHVLDAPFSKLLYPAIGSMSSQDRQEQVCEHFAANLLMPRTWVKQAYLNEGVQDVRSLARRFDTSLQATRLRLTLLGLIEPTGRCDRTLTAAAR